MAWIFQAIPKRYDLRTELNVDSTETWLVTRYREEMSRDDIVYFWMAGPEDSRGLYGWGKIKADTVRFYPEWGHGVEVEYKGVFEPHVSVRKVRETPELANLLLLKMPIGTNFKLTDAEHQALRKLIVELGHSEVPGE